MKKTLLLALCAVALVGCSQKRPAVVEFPAFEVWNNGTVEVAKIEMSDTATVLHMRGYMKRGWFMISPDTYIRNSDGGEKLIVTRADGITLGGKIAPTDSGVNYFTLYFPALSSDVKRIDFIESDCDNCFKIFGLRLLPNDKVRVDALPKFAQREEKRNLPAPVFSAEKAKISGQYSGYRTDLGYSEVVVNYSKPLTTEYEEVALKINPDGTFGGEVAVGFPRVVRSSIGTLFLVPGKETKVYIDLKRSARKNARLRKDKEPADSVNTFMGGSGLSFGDLKQLRKVNDAFYNYSNVEVLSNLLKMSPKEYSEQISRILVEKIAEVDAMNFPPELKRLAHANLKMAVIVNLLSYDQTMIYAYGRVHKISDEGKIAYKPQGIDLNFYAPFGELVNDDLAYFEHFDMLIKALCLKDVFMPRVAMSIAERLEYFKENDALPLGIESKILPDAMRAYLYGEQLRRQEVFSESQKTEITNAFADNKAYAEALIAEVDALKVALAESTPAQVNTVPDVPQKKVFDAIVSKYKGKVVVVDFWATWCGPCKMAMKEMKPLKEELKGSDVVFVYLTGETSPEATWNRMIKDIDGEHYRVSKEQWEYWYKAFKIEGVPTFIIFDKNGKQSYRDEAGFPGKEVMKGEIVRLMK